MGRLACLLFTLGLPTMAAAQARIAPVFSTEEDTEANVDSCAIWVAPDPADSLLFVTEKDGDRVQVLRATTGEPYLARPYLGGTVAGTAPGEFDRPNGVWVIPHVPHAQGFADILLVTDQRNQRVQIFRLPGLEVFGEFGAGEVGKGYGIAWYHDGRDVFVFITDTEPPPGYPGVIKKYRLRPEGAGLGGDLVFGFGSRDGEPPLGSVESIVADHANNRLHVCGDEGGDFNRVFDLDGVYTGLEYGDPQFESDQEGVNLYDLGGPQGYIIVSDQLRGGAPNEFEVFDRVTLQPLGNFRSADGGVVTSNTDGTFLEQRPLPGFPDGAFFAVNDDRNVHAYDWTDIAGALSLEISPLDRPFPTASPPDEPWPESHRSLWHHDGSWWGVVPGETGLELSRLEDGTFSRRQAIGPGTKALVSARGESVGILVATGEDGRPRFLLLDYDASGRRYLPRGDEAILSSIRGEGIDVLLEADGNGGPTAIRARAAAVVAGELRVTWTGPTPLEWDRDGVSLGDAVNAAPGLLRLPGATGLVWGGRDGVVFRLHADGDPPGTWSPAETAGAGTIRAIGADSTPDGKVVALAVDREGGGLLLGRSVEGGWTERLLAGEILSPALVVDPARGLARFFHLRRDGGLGRLYQGLAGLEMLEADPTRYLAGWPGVDLATLLVPRSLAPAATDLVAVAIGSDARGYLARLPRPGTADLSAPITMQHLPVPGDRIAPGGVISFRVRDDRAGVDPSAIALIVDDVPVATRVRGVPRSLLVSATVPEGAGPIVQIRIEAADRASPPHVMTPFEYEAGVGEGTGSKFRRGDTNGDDLVDTSDMIFLLEHLFLRGPGPECDDAADVNDDGRKDISDSMSGLFFLFAGAPAPPAPGPDEPGFDGTPSDPFPCGDGPLPGTPGD